MKTLGIMAFLLNLTAIFVLSTGIIYKFKTPKTKAYFGYCLVGSLLLYLISLLVLMTADLIFKQNFKALYLMIFIIAPFIIGKLVKYETLKKYTLVQIFCYCVSLITIILEYII